MRKTRKRPLSLILAFSFMFTSTVGAAPRKAKPTPVVAPIEQPGTEVPMSELKLPDGSDFDFEAAIQKADDYNQRYANLETLGAGQPRGSLAPDRFLLMEQTVFPKEVPVVRTFIGHIFRKWSALAMKSKVNAYVTALEKDPSQAKPFEKTLSDDEIVAKIQDHMENGRRTDTPLFIWERQKDPAQLQQIKSVLEQKLDYWLSNIRLQAPNPTDAPTERKVRYVNWWDLNLQVQTETEVVKTMRLRDTSAGVNTGIEQPYFCSETETCRFNLMQGQQHLHVFGIAAHVIGTFDQYVVFTHNDSYDAATGTQYISFIDLGAYNGVIGNEEVPVFRLPLKIGEPIKSLTVAEGKLVLNEKFTVEKRLFEQASELQQVAFNLQANLVSPDSWAKILPLVDSVQEYFKRTVDQTLAARGENKAGLQDATVLMKELGQELLRDLNAQKEIKPLSAEELAKLGTTKEQAAKEAAAVSALELYHKRVTGSSALARIMDQTAKRSRVSRQLKARVNLLAATLLSPRPFASQKIKEALGAWYVKYSKSKADSSKTRLLDKVIELSDRPFTNAGVVSAAILAAVAPDSFSMLIQAGLGASTAVSDYMISGLHGLGAAAVRGTQATWAAFTSPALADQYWNNGNFYRTVVGMSAFGAFLGGLYFVPHFLFNFAALFKDMSKPGYKGFVDRQNRFKAAYYKRLAVDEGERRDVGSDVQFSATEEEEIQAFIAERKVEISKRRRFFGLLGPKKRPVKETLEASLEDQTDQLEFAFDAATESTAVDKALKDTPQDFKNFWSAAKHFAFSTPALELTLEHWARIWNAWASWRFTAVGFAYVKIMGSKIPVFIKVRPISLAARLLYPDFMKTAVFSHKGRIVLPTEANGGLKNLCNKANELICTLQNYNSSPENFSPLTQLQALRQFEKQIIDAEDQIVEVAFRRSLEALPTFMKSKKDLKALFGSRALTSITQKEISNLSWASQTFLRSHFQSIYDAAMARFLADTLTESAPGADAAPVAPAQITAEVIEDASTPLPVDIPGEENPDYSIDQDSAQAMLRSAKQQLVALHAKDGVLADYAFDIDKAKAAALALADDPVHFENAANTVRKGRLSPGNFAMNTRFDLAATMDPKQNPSWARVETVHSRLESPTALGRAVRAEIVKLFLTLPVDMGFKLLFAAGIYEGAMKPIQEEFMGPNSTFYLSSTSFYMMAASGFFMSIMADAWLKLQEDARQDEMGEFGKIPQGEAAQKSFFNWYMTQFRAKQNSILGNWAFANKLAFWNMPAALANMTLFYYMFSGRIDMSLIVAGYAMSFGTPLSAFHYKVDQAFERAAHYAARGIKDERWMAHPKIQELLTSESQRLRFRFSLLNDLYGNIMGSWLGNIEMIPTEAGTRGFQRALFGGGLVEEYIVNNALTPLQNAVHGIPVLDHVLSPLLAGCQSLLTHGNVDLVIPDKYGPEDGLLFDLEQLQYQGPGSLNP